MEVPEPRLAQAQRVLHPHPGVVQAQAKWQQQAHLGALEALEALLRRRMARSDRWWWRGHDRREGIVTRLKLPV